MHMSQVDVRHHTIAANGIQIGYIEAGSGPLVILCHGFPDTSHTWRHQIAALANAGYRVIAPDMRGYGSTTAPTEVSQYTLLHMVGDVFAVMDAAGEKKGVVVGHDWGAPVAWHCALLRPDRVCGVAGLSVPFRPRGPARPSSTMVRSPSQRFYQLYFMEEGSAEKEFESNAQETIRKIAWLWSGAFSAECRVDLTMVKWGAGLFTSHAIPAGLPSWMDAEDLSVYAEAFGRSGFRGGLNWYRNHDANWELTAAWRKATITAPALYVAGEFDFVLRFPGMDMALAEFERHVPALTQKVLVPGAGHWAHREYPEAVNKHLLTFLAQLPALRSVSSY